LVINKNTSTHTQTHTHQHTNLSEQECINYIALADVVQAQLRVKKYRL